MCTYMDLCDLSHELIGLWISWAGTGYVNLVYACTVQCVYSQFLSVQSGKWKRRNWNGKLKRKTEAESGNGKAEIRKWSSTFLALRATVRACAIRLGQDPEGIK
jgi:hypothetical protein